MKSFKFGFRRILRYTILPRHKYLPESDGADLRGCFGKVFMSDSDTYIVGACGETLHLQVSRTWADPWQNHRPSKTRGILGLVLGPCRLFTPWDSRTPHVPQSWAACTVQIFLDEKTRWQGCLSRSGPNLTPFCRVSRIRRSGHSFKNWRRDQVSPSLPVMTLALTSRCRRQRHSKIHLHHSQSHCTAQILDANTLSHYWTHQNLKRQPKNSIEKNRTIFFRSSAVCVSFSWESVSTQQNRLVAWEKLIF